MDIKYIIKFVAEKEGKSVEQVEQEFTEYFDDVNKHMQDGWQFTYIKPEYDIKNKCGGPYTLELYDGTILNDCYYSKTAGWSKTTSFYEEHLIDDKKIMWYK